MKKLFFVLAITIISFSTASEASNCKIKGVKDAIDGAVYYDKGHRLYKHVKLNKSNGDKTFCDKSKARRAGFKEAPNSFSGSTARLIECTEDGDRSCKNYVLGQFRSLNIYDKVCASGASNGEIVSKFISFAKRDKKNLNAAKFYGTTGALMKAFPCRGGKHASK